MEATPVENQTAAVEAPVAPAPVAAWVIIGKWLICSEQPAPEVAAPAAEAPAAPVPETKEAEVPKKKEEAPVEEELVASVVEKDER